MSSVNYEQLDVRGFGEDEGGSWVDKWTDERMSIISSMRRQGFTYKKLAALNDCAVGTLQRRLSEYWLSPQTRRNQKEEREEDSDELRVVLPDYYHTAIKAMKALKVMYYCHCILTHEKE